MILPNGTLVKGFYADFSIIIQKKPAVPLHKKGNLKFSEKSLDFFEKLWYTYYRKT